MSIPKAFFPVLTQFADFSRKKIRINTIGKDSATAGDLTTILLPEGKLDLSTFSLGGLCKVTGTGALAQAPAVEQLIESIMVEVGSVQLHPSFNMYGHVWGMLADLQGHWNKQGIRKMLNLQPTNATVVDQNTTPVPFQLSHFLGFLNDVKILNTDRLPPVRITIRWASNAVLAGATSATAATYTLSNLYTLVDMVKLSPVYDELLSAKISQSPLQIPYTNYQVIPGVQGNLTNTVRWSSTSDSLQKVYGTFIPTNYQTFQLIEPVTYLSKVFNRGSTNLKSGLTSRYTINGNSFPDIPLDAALGEILQHTLEAVNENHDVTSQTHPNLDTLDKFHTNFFVHCNSFTYDSDGGMDASSRKCGLSALGQNLQGSWETVGVNTTDTVQPIVVLETKAVLEVGPARTVRVIY
jgi:hypothetical protein